VAPRGGVTFAEDQVDRREYSVETLGHVTRIGHCERNSRIADLSFRAYEALRHRGSGNEKRPRDFIGLQSTERAQRQRHLRFQGERRMTTSKDQTQAVVRNFTVVEIGFIDDLTRKKLRMRFEFFLQAGLSPQTIDGLVFSRLNDPGAGRLRHAFSAPLVHGRRERFLSSIFSQFEVAELTYEGRDNAAPVRPVDRIDRNIGVWKHV